MVEIDAYGFSIMGTEQLLLTFALSKLIKSRWPDSIIIAGGTHITAKRNEILSDKRYFTYFDYFLPFHSEEVLRECLEQKRFEGMAGVISLNSPYVEKEYIPDFEDYYIEKKDLELYANCTIPTQIETCCHFGQCSMCTYNSIEQAGNLKLDGELFLEKLDSQVACCKKLSIADISFKDSNLFHDKLLLIAHHLMGKGFSWNGCTQVNKMFTYDDFKLLKDSGCANLEVGVESIHPRIQKIIRKQYSLEAIETFIDRSIKAGLPLMVNLIFGFPTETLDEAKEQLAWFISLKKSKRQNEPLIQIDIPR
jgi:radical SAM superfamily enzyme YgiQ (UPF0313 family)